MNRTIAMTSSSSSRPTAPHLPVLLIITPATPTPAVEGALDIICSVLSRDVQIMRVNEKTHSEVVRSFGFTSLPAFVLLRQGLELWRHSGPLDSPDLLRHLAQTSLATVNPPSI